MNKNIILFQRQTTQRSALFCIRIKTTVAFYFDENDFDDSSLVHIGRENK